jgi:hypothetical protein
MKIVPILIKKVQPANSEVLVDLKNIKNPGNIRPGNGTISPYLILL